MFPGHRPPVLGGVSTVVLPRLSLGGGEYSLLCLRDGTPGSTLNKSRTACNKRCYICVM